MAASGRRTLQVRKGTHTCPSSWAMVKAALRPFSSLMEQLLKGSHRVPNSAKPTKMTHTHLIKGEAPPKSQCETKYKALVGAL